jgi:hypothetical protein
MVVALCGGGSVAMAQGVSVGVKGGVSFTTLTPEVSENNVDLDRRTGIVAGAFVTWPLAEHVGLQLEGLYAQKGTAFDRPGFTGTTKLDYFEVPMLLVASTAHSHSGTSFQFFGGPSVAFKVSAKSSASTQEETVDVDIPDEWIEGVDWGVVAGAGVTFGRISVEGRYTFGLNDINGEPEARTKVRNGSAAVLAGFRF